MSNPSMPMSQGAALGTILGSIIIPIIFTFFRFLGRRVERVSWWWDDWLILLSLLLLSADFWAALQIIQSLPSSTDTTTSSGPTPSSVSAFLLRLYITNLLHPLIVTTTKLSALLLYILHFGPSRKYTLPTYVLMILSAIWGIGTFFATLFTCNPVAGAFSILPPSPSQSSSAGSATCLPLPPLLRATSITDAVLNTLILLATFPGSYSLDWIFGRGTIITSLYLTGLFIVISNILTAYYTPPSSTLSLPLTTTSFEFDLSPNTISSAADLAKSFGPYLFWLKMVEANALVVANMYPAGFGLLALFTWNFEEPKERLFGYFRRKTRRVVRKAGLGALLGGSEERREMERREREGEERMRMKEMSLKGGEVGVEMRELGGRDKWRGGKGQEEGKEDREARKRLEEFRRGLDREVLGGSGRGIGMGRSDRSGRSGSYARSVSGTRGTEDGRKAAEEREMV